ncbi:hypothetical protein V8E52_003019 [Russula decolorans]
MISKSFIIQAFIALMILASSSTFPVNAAAISPARFSRQDYVPVRAALSAATTADNEKRFWFAPGHEAYESTVGLPHWLPISERASAPIADLQSPDLPDSDSLNDSVPAPVMARKFNPCNAQLCSARPYTLLEEVWIPFVDYQNLKPECRCVARMGICTEWALAYLPSLTACGLPLS